ncbi:MAG TPA: sigma factor [Actinomycetota bacterium]|nr:sigma factor [Actinomycetota bacterium]
MRYLAVVSPAAVEDLASETWLGVVRGLERFEGNEPAFRAWVFTIARHEVLDWRRRAARRAAEDLPANGLAERAAPDDPAAGDGQGADPPWAAPAGRAAGRRRAHAEGGVTRWTLATLPLLTCADHPATATPTRSPSTRPPSSGW